MTDWMKLYSQRDWDALDDWWRGCENPEDVAAFYDRLLADVPKVTLQNGMDEQDDYVSPSEAPDAWKGAAKILLMGELEATVEGAPEPVPDQWRRERDKIVHLLGELKLVRADDVKSGDPSLSRSAHAKNALDLFSSIDWCVGTMANEIDPDGAMAGEREWLIDFADEIVSLAFNAGAHARAAIGKEIEGHAIRGKKTLSSAKEGGRLRKNQLAQQTATTLQAMNELIALESGPINLLEREPWA
jgi:hypothetical protein